MANIVFDNIGDGDGEWGTAANWAGGVKPTAIDSFQISANCNCNETAPAANEFGANCTVDAAITLTMDGAGAVLLKNIDLTFGAASVLAFDGGVLSLEETDSAMHDINMSCNVTTTANGGTIILKGAHAAWNMGARIEYRADGYSFAGNAAARLLIDGTGGAAYGLFLSQRPLTIANVDFDQVQVAAQAMNVIGTNSLFHDIATNGQACLLIGAAAWVSLRDCFLYNSGNASYGVQFVAPSFLTCENVVFGKTEAPAGSENGSGDIYVPGYSVSGQIGHVRLHNCELASTTQVASAVEGYPDIVSTADDQVTDQFKIWERHGGVITTNAAGQAGNGLTLTTGALPGAADTDWYRMRHLLALIPAVHGDTIDVTVYSKAAGGVGGTLRIDPDSIYGTIQTVATTGGDGNWNQETIPQYTVNTGAGEKHLIPVYLDITSSAISVQIDTLAATVVGTGTNQAVSYEYIFDGVPGNDPVAAGGGGAVGRGFQRGMA